MPVLVVFGITGRMGQSLVRALRDVQGAEGSLRLCGAVASAASSRLGQDAALEGNPEAGDFFKTLTGVQRYAFLYRLHHTKEPRRRAERIAHYVELLSRRETLVRE